MFQKSQIIRLQNSIKCVFLVMVTMDTGSLQLIGGGRKLLIAICFSGRTKYIEKDL